MKSYRKGCYLKSLICIIFWGHLLVPSISMSQMELSLQGKLYHHWSTAYNFCVYEDQMFVATNISGCAILSLETPTSPETITGIDVLSSCTEVTFCEDRLFMSDNYVGLRVFSITQNDLPQQTGIFEDTEYAWLNAEVLDHYLICKRRIAWAAQDEIIVLDISDPDDPISTYIDTPNTYIHDILIYNDLIYFCMMNRIEVRSLNQAGELEVLGILEYDSNEPFKIIVFGDYAYVPSNGTTLDIINVSDPSHLEIENQLTNLNFISPDMIAIEDQIYIADLGVLHIMSLSDPLEPEIILSINTDNFNLVTDIQYHNPLLYVSSYPYDENLKCGVAAVDIGGDTPVIYDVAKSSSMIYQVAAHGNNILLTGYKEGIQYFDISNPSNPVLTGTIEDSSFELDELELYQRGQNMAFLEKDRGIHILDLDNPNNPHIDGSYMLGGGSWYEYSFDMSEEDKACLFVANTLYFIDISDRSNPFTTAIIDTFFNNSIVDLALTSSGNYLYLLEENRRVLCYSLDNMENPQFISVFEFDQDVTHLDVDELFGVCTFVEFNMIDSSPIYLLDLSNPALPGISCEFGSQHTPELDIEIQDSTIWLYSKKPYIELTDNFECNFAIYRIEDDGTSVVPIAYDNHGQSDSHDMTRTNNSIVLSRNHTINLYSADILTSINERDILFEIPTASNLMTCCPNPFNATTSVPFDISVTQPVRIAVFDLLGRHVQTLQNGILPAGNHRILFRPDGLASGTYFIRLETETEMQSTKVILLK